MTETRASETIGFIGLGNMGLPMCLNLVDAGFDVVALDLRPEPVAEVVAAGVALTELERLGQLEPKAARRGAWVPWDGFHFVCSVNRELNVLMLNMLCDPAKL